MSAEPQNKESSNSVKPKYFFYLAYVLRSGIVQPVDGRFCFVCCLMHHIEDRGEENLSLLPLDPPRLLTVYQDTNKALSKEGCGKAFGWNGRFDERSTNFAGEVFIVRLDDKGNVLTVQAKSDLIRTNNEAEWRNTLTGKRRFSN